MRSVVWEHKWTFLLAAIACCGLLLVLLAVQNRTPKTIELHDQIILGPVKPGGNVFVVHGITTDGPDKSRSCRVFLLSELDGPRRILDLPVAATSKGTEKMSASIAASLETRGIAHSGDELDILVSVCSGFLRGAPLTKHASMPEAAPVILAKRLRPHWAAYIGIVIASISVAAITLYVLQKRARRSAGRVIDSLCSTCGYNLTGNRSMVCPECGNQIDGGKAWRCIHNSGQE